MGDASDFCLLRVGFPPYRGMLAVVFSELLWSEWVTASSGPGTVYAFTIKLLYCLKKIKMFKLQSNVHGITGDHS